MSAFTSFDALHEPPSLSEDPPENVLSKLFQRVKSTLSTSNIAPPSSPTPSTSDHVNTTPLPTVSSSTTLHAGGTADVHLTAILANSSAGNNNGSQSSINIQSRNNGSEQYLTRIHDKASSTASSSASTTGTSETGSWIVTSESPSSNNNNSTKLALTSSNSNSSASNNNITARQGVAEDNSKDRVSMVRRSYPATASSTTPKRASSLFKVSTLDHSIVQDDDTASLSSLAPPVVSLSPAFGDQSESAGAVMSRPIDSRIVDHTRLSAGTFPFLRMHRRCGYTMLVYC